MKKLFVLLFAISAIVLVSCNSVEPTVEVTTIDSTVVDTCIVKIDTCAVKVDTCVVTPVVKK